MDTVFGTTVSDIVTMMRQLDFESAGESLVNDFGTLSNEQKQQFVHEMSKRTDGFGRPIPFMFFRDDEGDLLSDWAESGWDVQSLKLFRILIDKGFTFLSPSNGERQCAAYQAVKQLKRFSLARRSHLFKQQGYRVEFIKDVPDILWADFDGEAGFMAPFSGMWLEVVDQSFTKHVKLKTETELHAYRLKLKTHRQPWMAEPEWGQDSDTDFEFCFCNGDKHHDLVSIAIKTNGSFRIISDPGYTPPVQ